MKTQTIYHIIFIIYGFMILLAGAPALISLINKDFDYGSTLIGKLDLYLNERIYLDTIIWFCFHIFFIALGIYLYKYKKWSTINLFIFSLIYITLAIILLVPILSIMNVILMIICRNPPIYSTQEKTKIFPISKVIENNYQEIKREYQGYQGKRDCAHAQTVGFRIGKGEVNGNCWRMICLKQAGHINSIANYFPTTMNIIKESSIHNAFFSILDPHIDIPPHIGYYKGYLRYHLGVIIPEENGKRPYINVGGQKYEWREGEGVLFDDMFYHFVENPTNKVRVVLYIDIIRPLSEPLNTINRAIIRLIENNPIIKALISHQHQQVVKK